MGLLCLCFSAKAQNYVAPTTIKIGDKMPDVLLTHILNSRYKSAKLSDFKGKLIIVDFWAVWCGSCVKAIPELDSLQRAFPDKLQVLLVNPKKEVNSEKQVNTTIARINAWSATKLIVPIVFKDTAISKYFNFLSIPACAWIGPDGRLIAFTEGGQVTAANIEKVINREKLDLPVKDDYAFYLAKHKKIPEREASGTADNDDQPFFEIFGAVDSAGIQPLAGAHLIIKPRGNTETTDIKGHFTMVYSGKIDTLVITHAGYRTLTKIITPKTKYPLKLTLTSSFDQR